MTFQNGLGRILSHSLFYFQHHVFTFYIICAKGKFVKLVGTHKGIHQREIRVQRRVFSKIV